MSTFAAAGAVVTVAVLTYLARAGLILLLADRPLRPAIERALRNVGPAVLASLTVTLLAGGKGAAGIEAVEVAAVAVGCAVAAWRRDLILSLLAGMTTLWILLALT